MLLLKEKKPFTRDAIYSTLNELLRDEYPGGDPKQEKTELNMSILLLLQDGMIDCKNGLFSITEKGEEELCTPILDGRKTVKFVRECLDSLKADEEIKKIQVKLCQTSGNQS